MNELFLALVLICKTHEQHVGVEREVKLPAVQINGKTTSTHFAAYRNGASCSAISSSDGTLSVVFKDYDGTTLTATVKDGTEVTYR